jgi:hydrogenase maturation protease
VARWPLPYTATRPWRFSREGPPRLSHRSSAIWQLARQVKHFIPQYQTLVIGLGSHHGADAIGWLAVRALKQLDGALSTVEVASGGDLLDKILPHRRLLLCDGCLGAGEPGSVHHWSWPHIDLGRLKSFGTHDLSLAEVFGLSQVLGNLPRAVELWGIEVPMDAAKADRQWLANVSSRAAARIYAELNDA